MKRSLLITTIALIFVSFIAVNNKAGTGADKSMVKAENSVALKDRECSDCTKYMSFKVNSKQWYVCGQKQNDLNFAPIIYNNKTFCPLRQIPEKAGYSLTYNGATKTITLYSDFNKLEILMQIGNPIAVIDGNSVQIDENKKITPIVRNGATLLPMKFLLDSLSLKFEWYAQTKSFTIEYTDPACLKPFTFKLENTDGKQFDFSELKGKPVFIDFSASWCQPCWEAYPMLKDLYKKYGEKVEFIGVMYDEMADAVQTKEDDELPWTVLADTEAKVARSVCVNYYPTFVLLDKDHNIKEKFVGFDEEETIGILTKAFESIIK